MIQIIVISLLVISILLGILLLVVWKKRKPKDEKEVDYQAFFVMGISFIGMGTVFAAAINPGFLGITALVFVYMILGMLNRDNWKKKE